MTVLSRGATSPRFPVRRIPITDLSIRFTSHEETPMKITYVHGLRASRRAFFGKVAAAGAVVGAGVLSPRPAHADDEDGGQPNPIPGGRAPFAPFGVFIHHNALNPVVP